MDFIEQLETLANKIRKQMDVIKTEEATKMAYLQLVMIQTINKGF